MLYKNKLVLFFVVILAAIAIFWPKECGSSGAWGLYESKCKCFGFFVGDPFSESNRGLIIDAPFDYACFGIKIGKTKIVRDIGRDLMTDDFIEDFCGTERVCLFLDRKKIEKRDSDIFSIRILNELSGQNFDIKVTRPTPSGYDKNQIKIENDNLFWSPKSKNVFIKQGGIEKFNISVEVPRNALEGVYIFNVEIKTTDSSSYSPIQKFYVDVP